MRRPVLLFLCAASILVGAAIAVGVATIPPPWVQRKHDLDETRVRDLVTISNMIATYYRTHGRLPESVEELPGAPRLTDVETKTPYEYIVNNLRNYRLCANFKSDSANTTQSVPPERSGWKHEQGNYCFSIAIPVQPDR
jgi:hypothetical protein